MSPERTLTIGTRASALAKRQTQLVTEALKAKKPDVSFIIKEIKTSGDTSISKSMVQLDKGAFTKELEVALIDKSIDAAVHSFKDLPTTLAPEFTIAAITEREDVRDVLISKSGKHLADLPKRSRVGTGSPRRAAQLKAYRPDLEIIPIRGNVDTRIKKAMTEDYDAIVLAAAGILRLGMQNKITEYLPIEISIPAPGQGAIAIESLKNSKALATLKLIDHAKTHVAVEAEKAFLECFGGGCRVPLGGYATIYGSTLRLIGMIASENGSKVLRAELQGKTTDAKRIALALADKLISMGADKIIAGVKS